MTISTINNIVSSGTLASRPTTPALATPASGSNPSVIYLATDTGDTYMWNFAGTAWVKVDTGAVVQIAASSPTGVSFVTFSSLGDYNNLLIKGTAISTASSTFVQLNMIFNGDMGANYDTQQAYTNNTTSSGSATIAGTSINIASPPGASFTSVIPAMFNVDIIDYNGTSFHKSVIAESGSETATGPSGIIQLNNYGWWHSISAISSVTLSLSSGNFVTGSRIYLYGVT